MSCGSSLKKWWGSVSAIWCPPSRRENENGKRKDISGGKSPVVEGCWRQLPVRWGRISRSQAQVARKTRRRSLGLELAVVECNKRSLISSLSTGFGQHQPTNLRQQRLNSCSFWRQIQTIQIVKKKNENRSSVCVCICVRVRDYNKLLSGFHWVGSAIFSLCFLSCEISML